MYNVATNKYEGWIYIFINKINNKKYVGQTIQGLKERYYQHMTESKNPRFSIHRAINKYGRKNFEHLELEHIICDTEEDLLNLLDEREIYWIDYYDCYTNGYNQTIGGRDNAPNKWEERPVIEYDLNGIKLNEYTSLTEASFNTSLSRSDITSCCMKTKVNRVGNKVFRYKEDPLSKEEIEWYILRYPKIYQYDFDGNLLNIFETIVQAERYLNNIGVADGLTNISACCTGKLHSCLGYVWRKYPDQFNTYATPKKQRFIEQRNAYTGELINKYENIQKANISIGKPKDHSSISVCINGNARSNNAHGFLWCYEGDYSEKIITIPKEKAITQYDLNGNFISTYNSIKEAADELQINRSTI